MESGQETPLTDHECRPVRLLVRQKPRRRHRAGENVMFSHVNAQPLQTCGDVAPGALAVVGQEEEGDVGLTQSVHEPIRAGDELTTPVDHSVHVNQVS